MNPYNEWITDLLHSLIKSMENKPVSFSLCIPSDDDEKRIFIRVTHILRTEKNLLIDQTSFKDYYSHIMEGKYERSQSIEDATKNCIGLVQQWLDN